MKTYKERWSDVEFLESIKEEISTLFYKNVTCLENIDLAGITIGGNSVLVENPSLYKSTLIKVDLSYSNIFVNAQESNWSQVNFTKAKLDRCSLNKSHIKDCNFQGAKLVINTDDSVFENCNFINTKIGIGTLGYEYGGRRVKFYNCDFTNALFKGVEFRASKFVNCNFTETEFVNCDFRGVKVDGGIVPLASQFEKMDIPEWVVE